MPQRHGPAFGNGCFAVRQARGKRVESAQRDDFAAGLSRDRFEQGAIRFERTKFLGRRIGRPAGFGAADFCPGFIRDRPFGAVTARFAWDVGRVIKPALVKGRLGRDAYRIGRGSMRFDVGVGLQL